VRLMN
jgi:hypothetical protein